MAGTFSWLARSPTKLDSPAKALATAVNMRDSNEMIALFEALAFYGIDYFEKQCDNASRLARRHGLKSAPRGKPAAH